MALVVGDVALRRATSVGEVDLDLDLTGWQRIGVALKDVTCICRSIDS
jgi:hypothetical protein